MISHLGLGPDLLHPDSTSWQPWTPVHLTLHSGRVLAQNDGEGLTLFVWQIQTPPSSRPVPCRPGSEARDRASVLCALKVLRGLILAWLSPVSSSWSEPSPAGRLLRVAEEPRGGRIQSPSPEQGQASVQALGY